MPRPQRHSDDPNPFERPPIWVAGRQQPRFFPLAWIRVGTAMTRRWLAPWMDRGSAAVKVFAVQIDDGRFKLRLGWLGRVERHLPTREKVSDTVAGFATSMAKARQLLHPRAEPPPALAYPNLFQPKTKPLQPATSDTPAQRSLSDHDPAVRAIRAMMQETAEPEASAKPHPAAARFLPIEPPQPMPPTFLMRIVAHLIAWPALALTLPVGLAQATLFHLNGGDLKDWD